jgi:hypothetical protein
MDGRSIEASMHMAFMGHNLQKQLQVHFQTPKSIIIQAVYLVLSHYLSKNLIITSFTFQLKLRLDVQAPPLSKSYNSTGRLFQIEIHFKL